MASPNIERADRLLVWLFLLTLVFGGLATIAVVFSADAVLAGLSRSASEPQGPGGHEDPAGHDVGTVGTMAPMPQDHAGMTMDEHATRTLAPPTATAPHGHNGMSMPGHTAPTTAVTTP